MSFRDRLTLFFIVIVIVPMIAVALVLFRLVSDSEQGKGDARLAQAQRAAQGLFRESQDRGAGGGRARSAATPELARRDPRRRPRARSRAALQGARRRRRRRSASLLRARRAAAASTCGDKDGDRARAASS